MRVAVHTPGRGTVELDAALAATPQSRSAGFSGRTWIAPWEAIFFAFPHDTTAPFTMAGTGVPLDMVFVDRLGRVAWLAAAAAYDPRPYQPPRAYRYVLEVPAGWIREHGVGMTSGFGWMGQELGAVT